MLGMNRLDIAKRAQIIGLLVEGNSLRAASRLADVSINTVTKLLVDVGSAALAYQDEHLRKLNSDKIQVDEIWAFVGAKSANATKDQKAEGWGDVWTWTAIDADTKLIPCWMVGPRNAEAARYFLADLASRLKNRVQLTSDGWAGYKQAVYLAFGEEIDYAQLVKVYASVVTGGPSRYSPPPCVGAEKHAVCGYPLKRDVSTSYVERSNLTMRTNIRRFTRLTNAFSKKVENHAHAVSLHFMYYNFGRLHKTLRVTPAMAAGVANHVWTLEEIAALAVN
jgi:IS1 family transposase